ncbi:hypothetical protein AOLI_G00319880 [Acnodon oligacanthus]
MHLKEEYASVKMLLAGILKRTLTSGTGLSGQNNVKWEPLVDPHKVLMPPLQIKLGLIKQFVTALDKESRAFKCMASLYKEPDWSTKLETVKDDIVRRLAEGSVSWWKKGQKLMQYYTEKDSFSLTDVWAALIVSNIFKESQAKRRRTAQVTQSDEPDISDMSVGLLSISNSSTDATFFCPERTAVVLEGNMVIELSTLADTFVMLFALMYALHLSYPKELANTFDFTQKILMGLEDGKLRPRVLTL